MADDLAGAFQKALEAEMENLRADLAGALYGPIKLAGLQNIIGGQVNLDPATPPAWLAGVEVDSAGYSRAEPDPLDEILDAAGVAERPQPVRHREHPEPEWITCDSCGQPVAFDGEVWLDRNYKSRCDGRLIPPGRDLRPEAQRRYWHTDRSGYIDHEAIDIQWYGEQVSKERLAGFKITDITAS